MIEKIVSELIRENRKKYFIAFFLILFLVCSFNQVKAEYNFEKEGIKLTVAEKVSLGGKVLIAEGKNIYGVMGRAMYELYFTGVDEEKIYLHAKVQDYLNKADVSNIKPAGSIWEYNFVIPINQKSIVLNLLHLGGEDVKQKPSIELKIKDMNEKMQLILDDPQNFKIK